MLGHAPVVDHSLVDRENPFKNAKPDIRAIASRKIFGILALILDDSYSATYLRILNNFIFTRKIMHRYLLDAAFIT